jgi:hypothetical protein
MSFPFRDLKPGFVALACGICVFCCADQIDVPITVGSGLPIVKVIVDGSAECWAVVDTGSSVTVIHPSAFGMNVKSEDSPRDGKTHVLAKRQPKLQIGAYTPAKVTALVADLPAMSLSLGGRHIQMLLGRDVLGQCPFGIDLARASITFFPGETATPEFTRRWLLGPGPVSHIAFSDKGDVLDLPLTLIGHRGQAASESVWAFDSWLGPMQEAWIVFDTGNNKLALNERLQEGAEWRILKTAPVETPLGQVQQQFVAVPHLIVANLLLRNAQGYLQGRSTIDDGYIGPIGLGVKRFLLDPTSLTLHVPNGDNAVPWLPAPPKGSVAFLYKDGKIAVCRGPGDYTVDDVANLQDVVAGPTAKFGYVDSQAGGKTSRTYTLR